MGRRSSTLTALIVAALVVGPAAAARPASGDGAVTNAATSTVVAYSGGQLSIPDGSTTGATGSVAVGNVGTVSGIDVILDGGGCRVDGQSTLPGIEHSHRSDLVGTLQSPTGTTVTLFSHVGSDLDDFCRTWFTDAAATSIQDVGDNEFFPLNRPYKPMQSTTAFVGENAQGTWKFKVADTVLGHDGGKVNGFTLRVTTGSAAGNHAPVAAADTFVWNQGMAPHIDPSGPLLNDTDADGDPIIWVPQSPFTQQDLHYTPQGEIFYTPLSGCTGSHTITYKTWDGVAASATVNAVIHCIPPPTGVADSYSANSGQQLDVPAPGVLGNDSVSGGHTLTARKANGPSHGTVTLNSNGSFTYTPTNGYSGPDSFSYWADVDRAYSSPTTVSLTVGTTTNQAPVATADSYPAVTQVAMSRTVPGILGNDTDPDAQTLSVSLVSAPSHGLLALSSNGSFSYKPSAGFTGTDSFTYRAYDGVAYSSPAAVTFTVVSPTSAYVTSIYADFLTRVAESSGLAYWGGRLDRGVETRTSFVLKMSRSHEYSVKVVNRAFQGVLGRAVDPEGREYWANKVQKGMPVSTLILNLISSNEYVTKTGGTTAGWVNATYQAILGRQPSTSERNAQVALLNGGKTRLKVASELYASTESRQRRVRVQYVDLLNRQPTAGELSAGVTLLASKSDIDLAIQVGAGTEYYNASLVV